MAARPRSSATSGGGECSPRRGAPASGSRAGTTFDRPGNGVLRAVSAEAPRHFRPKKTKAGARPAPPRAIVFTALIGDCGDHRRDRLRRNKRGRRRTGVAARGTPGVEGGAVRRESAGEGVRPHAPRSAGVSSFRPPDSRNAGSPHRPGRRSSPDEAPPRSGSRAEACRAAARSTRSRAKLRHDPQPRPAPSRSAICSANEAPRPVPDGKAGSAAASRSCWSVTPLHRQTYMVSAIRRLGGPRL